MGFDAKTERLISLKKLSGKAHTSNDKGLANEALPSGITMSSATIFSEAIAASPTATPYQNDGVVEFLRLPVEFITGADTSDGRHGFRVKLPSDYVSNSTNPGKGTGIFVNNQVLNESNGKLQLVPPSYATAYEAKPHYGTIGSGTRIYLLDDRDWNLDYFNGVYFQQDPPGTGDHAQNPTYVEAYIYIGEFLDESSASGDITAVVAGTGLSGGANAGSATLNLDINGLAAEGGGGDLADAIAISDATDNNTKKITITQLQTLIGSGGDAFKTISVSGQSDVVADSATDTLTLTAGANVAITTNASSDTVTIATTDTNTTYTAGNGLDLTGTAFSVDLKEAVAAVGSIRCDGGMINNYHDADITIISTDGTSVNYTFDKNSAPDNTGPVIKIQGLGNDKAAIGAKLTAGINHSGGHNGKITAVSDGEASGPTITLTQATAGSAGNTTISFNDPSGAGIAIASQFSGGSSAGGLKIVSTELAVEPADFAGVGLEDGGSDKLRLNVHGLAADSNAGDLSDSIAISDASDSNLTKKITLTQLKARVNTDTDTTYTAGNGLGLSGTEFALDLKSTGGLKIDSTELAMDINNLGAESGGGALGDAIAISDAGDNLTKKITLTQLQTLIGGSGDPDLDFQGDSGGALSIDLDSETLTFAGGTGVTTTGSGNSLTIATDVAQSHVTSVGTLTSLGVTGDLTVDTNTLHVKSSTNKVGIGTTSPAKSLDISGDFKVSGTTTLNGIEYTWPASDGSDGQQLQTDGDGALTWTAAGSGSGSGDITAVVAGTGLSGGASSGSATVNLDINSLEADELAGNLSDTIAISDNSDSNAVKKISLTQLKTLVGPVGVTGDGGHRDKDVYPLSPTAALTNISLNSTDLSAVSYDPNSVDVFLNGMLLHSGSSSQVTASAADYYLSGPSTLQFAWAVEADDLLDVVVTEGAAPRDAPCITFEANNVLSNERVLRVSEILSLSTSNAGYIDLDVKRKKTIHNLSSTVSAGSSFDSQINFSGVDYDPQRIDVFVNGMLLVSGSNFDYLLSPTSSIVFSFDLFIDDSVIVSVI